MKSCAVLFSGGIDSTTALYWALARYEKVYPISFDYGQRHKIEIRMARRLCRRLNLSGIVLKADLTLIGGSALTDTRIPVPRYKGLGRIKTGTPSTYVPFRNGVFLALAASWAESRGVPDIICGFNVIDSPHYPDTRPEFVRSMEKAIRTGTRSAVGAPILRLLAPFIHLRKSAIIRQGLALGADYSYSVSCYSGREIPCAACSSCLLRERAWKEAGLKDPLLVRLRKEGKI